MICDNQINRMTRPAGNHAWRSANRFVAALLLLLISPALGGCMAYSSLTWGPPPPELSGIAVGLSRTEVEARLGAATDHDNNVYHYEYNTREVGGDMVLLGAALDVFTMGFTAVYAGDLRQAHRAQRAHAYIVYGPDGRTAGVSRDWADEVFRNWLLSADREQELAQLCLAARRGAAQAQHVQAVRYRYGLWNTEKDPTEALAWLKFAAFSGHPGAANLSAEWTSNLGSAARLAEEMFQSGGMRSCGDPSGDIPELASLPSSY